MTSALRPLDRSHKAYRRLERGMGIRPQTSKGALSLQRLKHTARARMLEAGTPFSTVATIIGWSPSTTVRMSRRYEHIGQAAQREASKL